VFGSTFNLTKPKPKKVQHENSDQMQKENFRRT